MFEKFRNKFPLTDAQWSDYTGRFKRMEVPAKTILLREGEVSRKLFLIEKGCLRVWFNNNGKDVSFQFFFENNTVSSVESFRKKIPSPVFIETLEPCVLWQTGKKDVDAMIAGINDIPVLRDQLTDALFERTFDYMKHFFSFIKDTPAQRYENLIKEKPQLVKRVPQHYIASYLGISPVHLSRIKNQLARKHQSPI